jgi:hypothetical protein
VKAHAPRSSRRAGASHFGGRGLAFRSSLVGRTGQPGALRFGRRLHVRWDSRRSRISLNAQRAAFGIGPSCDAEDDPGPRELAGTTGILYAFAPVAELSRMATLLELRSN